MTYTPNLSVRSAHNIPHLTTSLQPSSNKINFTSEYAMSIVVFPAMLLAIGILSILIFFFLMFFRCCCNCIKCGPKKVDINMMSDEEYEKWVNNTKKWKNRILIGFLVSLFALVVANHVLFYGNNELNLGKCFCCEWRLARCSF